MTKTPRIPHQNPDSPWRPKFSFPKWSALWVVFWGLSFLPQISLYAQQIPNQRAAVRGNAGSVNVRIDATTEAARNVGVKACLPAISRLSGLSINGSLANDVLVDWDRKNPSGGPFFSLTGIEIRDGAYAVSIAAVPTASGGCSFVAERMSIAPLACRAIAQSEMIGYVETRLLASVAVYTKAGEMGESVTLIDSPPGCLIVRRQVVYDWLEPGK